MLAAESTTVEFYPDGRLSFMTGTTNSVCKYGILSTAIAKAPYDYEWKYVTGIPILRDPRDRHPLLVYALSRGAAIAGGYARFCCSQSDFPTAPEDIDIYPLSIGMYTDITEYFSEECVCKSETVWASTFLLDDGDQPSEIQVICPDMLPDLEYGSSVRKLGGLIRPTDIISTFDFSVVRVCISEGNDALHSLETVASTNFVRDELEKRIRIESVQVTAETVPYRMQLVTDRLRKYFRKGYTISREELLKLKYEGGLNETDTDSILRWPGFVSDA